MIGSAKFIGTGVKARLSERVEYLKLIKGQQAFMSSVTAHSDHVGRSYADALRHSGRVRFFRLVFPLATVLAILAFIGSTIMSRALPEGMSLDDVEISGGELIMRNPVMTGQVGEDQSYTVTAARAIQNLSTPSIIRLEDIVADFPMGSSETALLNALSGIYYREKESLSLDQPFTVTTETGITAQLQSAQVDIRGGGLTSDGGISIDTDKGSIVAESLTMEDKGKVVIFERNVRMIIKPGAVRQTEKASDDQN